MVKKVQTTMSSGNAFKKDDEEDDQVSFFGYVSQKFHEKVILNHFQLYNTFLFLFFLDSLLPIYHRKASW